MSQHRGFLRAVVGGVVATQLCMSTIIGCNSEKPVQPAAGGGIGKIEGGHPDALLVPEIGAVKAIRVLDSTQHNRADQVIELKAPSDNDKIAAILEWLKNASILEPHQKMDKIALVTFTTATESWSINVLSARQPDKTFRIVLNRMAKSEEPYYIAGDVRDWERLLRDARKAK